MFAICRRVTGHDADAADAAQDAMISIVRGLATFDGRSSVSTWIYRIATNASLDELRRRRRRPLLQATPRSDAGGDGSPGATIGERADPEAGLRVDALGDRMLLDAALASLAVEFRVPVVLRDVGDLDYAQIAEVLDVPIGTVKSRIARGRAALAQSLSGEPGNHPSRSERHTPAP